MAARRFRASGEVRIVPSLHTDQDRCHDVIGVGRLDVQDSLGPGRASDSQAPGLTISRQPILVKTRGETA